MDPSLSHSWRSLNLVYTLTTCTSL
uniref:Uncharacterized protein n=1 Tax=Anguilla anguilla TaxID=7936 RepID=A0A0E9XQF8_ANGAN